MTLMSILETTELWNRPIGRVLRASSWLALYIAATGDHIAGKVFVSLVVLRIVCTQIYLYKRRSRCREAYRLRATQHGLAVARVSELEREIHAAVYGIEQEH